MVLLTIPQFIIAVKTINNDGIGITGFAIISVTNKFLLWHRIGIWAGAIVWCVICTILSHSSCVGPDVLARIFATCYANAINVVFIYCSVTKKTIWSSHLVSIESATHLTVLTPSSVWYTCTGWWFSFWSSTSSDRAFIVFSPTTGVSRLATGYHDPPPHSLTETATMFLLMVVSSLAMNSCLASAAAQEPGLSPGNTTGLIIVSLTTVKFSTASSCLMQGTMIMTAKLVIVFSQNSVSYSLVVILVVYFSTDLVDCICFLGAYLCIQ